MSFQYGETTNSTETQDYSVPNDWYNCRIDNVEVVEKKDVNGGAPKFYYAITFIGLEGKLKDRKLMGRFFHEGYSPNAVSRAREDLGKICKAIYGSFVQEAPEIAFADKLVSVKTKKGAPYNGKINSEPADYRPATLSSTTKSEPDLPF